MTKLFKQPIVRTKQNHSIWQAADDSLSLWDAILLKYKSGTGKMCDHHLAELCVYIVVNSHHLHIMKSQDIIYIHL